MLTCFDGVEKQLRVRVGVHVSVLDAGDVPDGLALKLVVCQAAELSDTSYRLPSHRNRAEMADVEQMKKIVPFVT